MTEISTTLIGDVVDSRGSSDRNELQRALGVVLGHANDILGPEQELAVTIGDEFQAGFAAAGQAAKASLLVRLMLLAETGVDARFGLGIGTVTVYDSKRTPISQDGPGWWAARRAINHANKLMSDSRTSFVRTWIESEEPAGHQAARAGAINSYLLCRDGIVNRMSPRARRLLLGVMLGQRQADLARQEGITQSAVSQSLSRSGANAIEASLCALSQVS